MTRRMVRSNTRKAFTLIELLLVLVILAVLAAVVVPKFTNRRQQANQSAAKTQIANFELSLSQFEIDAGRFPTTDEGLEALVTNPGVEGWNGYMKKIPNDPWGKPYVYRFPSNRGESHDYDVLSLGADGREGTEDDITN